MSAVDVSIQGTGFFAIQGRSVEGIEFVNDRVYGGENGVAYSDDQNMTCDIAQGAYEDGLIVAVNGREYMGDNVAGPEIE